MHSQSAVVSPGMVHVAPIHRTRIKKNRIRPQSTTHQQPNIFVHNSYSQGGIPGKAPAFERPQAIPQLLPASQTVVIRPTPSAFGCGRAEPSVVIVPSHAVRAKPARATKTRKFKKERPRAWSGGRRRDINKPTIINKLHQQATSTSYINQPPTIDEVAVQTRARTAHNRPEMKNLQYVGPAVFAGSSVQVGGGGLSRLGTYDQEVGLYDQASAQCMNMAASCVTISPHQQLTSTSRINTPQPVAGPGRPPPTAGQGTPAKRRRKLPPGPPLRIDPKLVDSKFLSNYFVGDMTNAKPVWVKKKQAELPGAITVYCELRFVKDVAETRIEQVDSSCCRVLVMPRMTGLQLLQAMEHAQNKHCVGWDHRLSLSRIGQDGKKIPPTRHLWEYNHDQRLELFGRLLFRTQGCCTIL